MLETAGTGAHTLAHKGLSALDVVFEDVVTSLFPKSSKLIYSPFIQGIDGDITKASGFGFYMAISDDHRIDGFYQLAALLQIDCDTKFLDIDITLNTEWSGLDVETINLKSTIKNLPVIHPKTPKNCGLTEKAIEEKGLLLSVNEVVELLKLSTETGKKTVEELVKTKELKSIDLGGDVSNGDQQIITSASLLDLLKGSKRKTEENE